MIIPTSRPKATREEILRHITAAGLDVSREKAVIVYVRGYYRDSMGKPGRNDIGIYDDAAFVVTEKVFRAFNANTDPAKAGHSFAMLEPGVYDFYQGKHKGKYDALRPYPEGVRLPCTRDGVRSTCANTNQHRGGYNATYSEGCLTFPPSQYDEFIRVAYGEMNRFGKKTIKTVLVENK